jgi:hypothetical protein
LSHFIAKLSTAFTDGLDLGFTVRGRIGGETLAIGIPTSTVARLRHRSLAGRGLERRGSIDQKEREEELEFHFFKIRTDENGWI